MPTAQDNNTVNNRFTRRRNTYEHYPPATGVYTYDQPENNFFKKNIFQTFLKNQKKSLIKTNLKINTNIFSICKYAN